jgi:hypothetical protein
MSIFGKDTNLNHFVRCFKGSETFEFMQRIDTKLQMDNYAMHTIWCDPNYLIIMDSRKRTCIS